MQRTSATSLLCLINKPAFDAFASVVQRPAAEEPALRGFGLAANVATDGGNCAGQERENLPSETTQPTGPGRLRVSRTREEPKL
jgi:hypothetical protein